MQLEQTLALAKLMAAGWTRTTKRDDVLVKKCGVWTVTLEIDFIEDEYFIPIARIDFSEDSYVAFAGDRQLLDLIEDSVLLTVSTAVQAAATIAGRN